MSKTIDVNVGDSILVGPEGPQGIQGIQGPEGKSAYEVAVENGFTGTEEEWLNSLKAAIDDSKTATDTTWSSIKVDANIRKNLEGNLVDYTGTFEELQSDSKVDTTKIYRINNNSDTNYNNHFVYYNGTSWIDGGVYKSVLINDNSISVEKLKDNVGVAIDFNKSIFNFDTTKMIYIYNFGNFVISYPSGNKVSNPKRVSVNDFIDLSNIKNPYFELIDKNFSFGILYFNADKELIKETGWQNSSIDIEKDYLIKFNIKKNNEEELDLSLFNNQNYLDIFCIKNKDVEDKYISYNIHNNKISESNIFNSNIENSFTFEKLFTITPNKVWSFAASGSVIEVSATNRAHTDEMKIYNDFKIIIPAGYRIGPCINNEDGTFTDVGWQTVIYSKGKGIYRFNFARTDNATLSEEDVNVFRNLFVDTTISQNNNDLRKFIINDINIEFSRIYNTDYLLARIPKNTSIIPKIHLTSTYGTIEGAKSSTLKYAKSNNCIFTINAGLFNTTNIQPVGQTIIEGNILVNIPMESDNGIPISENECYPLCIKENGEMGAPYDRDIDCSTILEDGYKECITGWGKIIENFEPYTPTIDGEIVHPGPYIRQIIGQYQNGDYCVLTSDATRNNVQNNTGLTYNQIAEILVNKGVKFAYSLDGGGSAETVLGVQQINPIYEGQYGRSVPTVISFEYFEEN